MSDDPNQPDRWSMPLMIGVLVVLALGMFFFLGKKKPDTPATGTGNDATIDLGDNTPKTPVVPPTVHPVDAPGEKLVKWTGGSNNAIQVTGDVQLSATELDMAHQKYPIQQVHKLEHAEILAAQNLFSSEAPYGSEGYLYSLDIPAKAKMLDKSTLCPSDDAHYMLRFTIADTDAHTESLYLAFFSGTTAPGLTVTTITSAPNCGTYAYTRKVGAK